VHRLERGLRRGEIGLLGLDLSISGHETARLSFRRGLGQPS
jgi:hypothetical protein